jgi:hypothetical protein
MMKYGNDDEKVRARSKDERIWKPAQDHSAQIAIDKRKSFRIPGGCA